MAEVIAAFGAISSVLQVVEFAAKVALHAHELTVAGQDALRENIEIARLAREYECIGGISRFKGTKEEEAIVRLGEQCRKEAQSLLKELQTLQVSEGSKGLRRLHEGSRKAARAVRKRKEIDRSRRLLQELNGQLSTALLQSLLTKHIERDTGRESPVSSTPFETAQVAEVVTAIEKSNEDDIGKVGILTEKLDQAAHQRIISSLLFTDMSLRRDAITRAYPKTFDQVLRDDAVGFRRWLRSEGGIFWISGKAGSGKSTLMRYLCDSPVTYELLGEWSGGRGLIFASYYFWYLGHTLQKSIHGLLRTILHQILRERPDLTRVAFPKHCGIPHDQSQPIQWDDAELLEAMHAISQSKSSPHSAKSFCIFIDGLDEYHGNHVELVQLLKSLSQHQDIKFCVSSRPWNAFLNAFESAVPTIHLERITRRDHERYVYGKLGVIGAGDLSGSGSGPSDLVTLADDIVNRAEGVFLWVMLVVKSVLEGLGEGDPVAMLRHRVQHFPTDLDDFFRNILNRVNKVYHYQTTQALTLAFLQFDPHNETAHLKARSASFVDYWLLLRDPKGLSDPRFAYDLKRVHVPEDGLGRMLRETRTFLSAACRDLLTLQSTRGTGASLRDNVCFLHRTVYDFLKSDQMQGLLYENIPTHFRDHTVFDLLDLARVKLSLDIAQYHEMVPMMQKVMRTVLEVRRDKLSEDYVSHAEAALLFHIPVFGWMTRHDTASDRFERFFNDNVEGIIFLAAFKKPELTTVLSDLVNYLPQSYPSYANTARTLVVMAALGENSINKFSLEEVDIAFLELFIKSAIVDLNHLFDHNESDQSLWQRFLTKWARSSGPDETCSRHV